MAKAAGPEPEPEPEPEPPQNTDVAASKAKTRGALLGGLRSGALEAAVAKMEEDTADSTPPIAGSAWVDAGLEGSPMVAGLQRELAELKIGQLRRRAVEAGLEEAAVDDALDSDTPREAVIALVVARVANEPVIKQGKLGKEGSGKGLFHSVNNVNHRFFDLDGMFLCYYQSASSGGFVPSECIKLAEISGCAPSPPGRTTKHGHPHTFSVVTERRTFHLIADGEGDLHAWVNAIHHNIALVQRAHRKQQPAGTG